MLTTESDVNSADSSLMGRCLTVRRSPPIRTSMIGGGVGRPSAGRL
ncbi:hypothetical protein [Mangrovactinospora gilvigrisea]|nr:hypothetical protein [Mangrovactinospora gilvigrisea]